MITHRIGVDVCMARQRTFFHKCHRCIYRGQSATWEPAEAPQAMINVHAAEEPVQVDVKPLKVGSKPGRKGKKGGAEAPAPKAAEAAG